MNVVVLMIGAAIGAPARFLIDGAVQRRHRTAFPWGTFAVNMSASVVLGVVTGAVTAGVLGTTAQVGLGTGLCGALSTYSTFSFETMRLWEQGERFYAAANVVASVIGGLGAALLAAAVTAAWQ